VNDSTRRIWLLSTLAVGLTLGGVSCGESSGGAGGQPGEEPGEETLAVIGAEGGVVEVTDGMLLGLRVEIPPGAFAEDTEVRILARADQGTTTALPPGLAALGFGFELDTASPLAEDVSIVFPIRSAATQPDQIVSAFYYDATEALWSTWFPETMEADQFSVETRRTGIWRWGLTLYEEVERESLIPQLVETIGANALASFEQSAQDFFDQAAADLRSSFTWNSCDALNSIFDSISMSADVAKATVENNLGSECGPCELGADVLFDDVERLIKAKFAASIGKAVLANTGDVPGAGGGGGIGGAILGFAFKVVANAYVRSLDEVELSCDYKCYSREKMDDPNYWNPVGDYYASQVLLTSILVGSTYSECVIQ